MNSDRIMASVLKRKRAPILTPDTPNWSKSLQSETGKLLRPPFNNEVDWEPAFNPSKELAQRNRVNGNGEEEVAYMSSPTSSQRKFFNKSSPKTIPKKKHGLGKTELKSETTHNAVKRQPVDTWGLSPPIGGRMIRSDPVFTGDEKFLIVANKSTIQVYATATSLLTRSIPLKLNTSSKRMTQIITFCLSPSNPNIIWVACSDGTVYSVDWKTGAGASSFWTISSSGCIHMTVASIESRSRLRDVVFTTEARKDGGFRITANELADPNGPIENSSRTIYTSQDRIQFIKAESQGSIIVGAAGKRVLVGRLRSTDFDTVDKIKFEFRTFETNDYIMTSDIRVTKRSHVGAHAKNKVKTTPVIDLVVGDVRGVVFIHDDLAEGLFGQPKNSIASGLSRLPRKLHWHRHAVNSVKWSLDGNYVVSGGSETVLVLWQLDTGKQEFLPHLASTIQNIVVSPTGSSYAVQLSNNSLLILSTSDLEAKSHIAGIQASVIQPPETRGSEVFKAEGKLWPKPLIQRIPAVINPALPLQMLLAVGQVQEVRASEPLVMSNPFLQMFDLSTSHSISTQALTRTNVLNINAAPNAHHITEPRVTQMKISFDGSWLATVDEWAPSSCEFEFLQRTEKDGSGELNHRREVFLKFWRWNQKNSTWELVSRINSPHLQPNGFGDTGRVLDLAADPSSQRFSTIGNDFVVRIWSAKSRKQYDGLVHGKENEIINYWHCLHAVNLGRPKLVDECGTSSSLPITGCVSFSEDGSILAAGLGIGDSLLHVLDPESGSIRISYNGLIEKELFSVEFLGQELIILSDKLLCFDLVSEEASFNFKLNPATASLSVDQKREMIHLAVDSKSKTFALALPKFYQSSRTLVGSTSEILLFHQESCDIQLVERHPSIITALLPATGFDGYLILDATAEIRTVVKKGSQAVTSLAQSTSTLQLETTEDSSEKLTDLVNEVEEVGDVEETYQVSTPAATQDGEDDDADDGFPVVTQHQLAKVFDIGPSFALPPIEEMFYQVAGLFSSKPLARSV